MLLSSTECAPTDILREICDYLDCYSLIALALATKRCASLAKVCLFLMIHTGPLSLTRGCIQADVNFWIRKHERASGLKHARRLKFDHSIVREQNVKDDAPKIRIQHTENGYPDYSVSDNDSVFSLIAATYPPEEAIEKDDAMRSLVEFISQIPALVVLSYTCSNQFLQATSRQDCPSLECGLHLRSFKIRSIERNDKCSHEVALESSPCLHSIGTGHSNINSDRRGDYNEKAVFWAISHLAPKHTEACIFYFRPDFPLLRLWVRMEIPWRGFIIGKQRPRALTKLELCRYSLITLNVVMTWSNLTNFAALRVLELSGTIDDKALSWLTTHCRFISLATLFLYIDLDWVGNPATDEYQGLLSSFIRSLPPLKILKIVSSFYTGSLIPSILEYHGKSLYHLEYHGKSLYHLELQIFRSYKPFIFEFDLVREIRRHCTELTF